MLVFLEPFLNGGFLFSRKANRENGKLKDEVSPCVIEVASSVDFQVGIFYMSCYSRAGFRSSLRDVGRVFLCSSNRKHSEGCEVLNFHGKHL